MKKTTVNIDPAEKSLEGKLIFQDGRLLRDAVSERIEWLTSHVLLRVAFHPQYGAWETLYTDPADGRLWEKTFPESGDQGGGPPRLVIIEKQNAEQKYQIRLGS